MQDLVITVQYFASTAYTRQYNVDGAQGGRLRIEILSERRTEVIY
jgi:hypothetical protein